MAQAMSAAGVGAKERTAARLDRRTLDTLISGTGAVVAIVLLFLGGIGVWGGLFARDNVADRLEPQNISFPPAAAMTPAEKAEIGEFAGQKVDTGAEAEAFSRYIGGHLADINEGATSSRRSRPSAGGGRCSTPR